MNFNLVHYLPLSLRRLVVTFCYVLWAIMLLVRLVPPVYAETVTQSAKLWTNIPITGAFTQARTWKYYLEPQLRFINDTYVFNEANLNVALGYQWLPSLSVWGGGWVHYAILTSGREQTEYRLWEQLLWEVVTSATLNVAIRTRFDHTKNTDYRQWSNRIREKITLKFPLFLGKNYFLVIGEEVFLQLTRPEWAANQILSQNRASIGIEIPVSLHHSLEIGYLNQFQNKQPIQISHVLNFQYNISF
jgi:hypothetical protein